jgi:hypothetical protein
MKLRFADVASTLLPLPSILLPFCFQKGGEVLLYALLWVVEEGKL